MAATVVWLPTVPAEIRAIAEPCIVPHTPLLPSWVTELRIDWDSAGDGGLRCKVSHEYRNGVLTIVPGFLDGSPTWRHESVIHELAHFALNPIHDFGLDCIVELERDNPALGRVLRERIRQCIEMSTCDLTEMILKAQRAPEPR